MVEVTANTLCGKVVLGRLSADAALRVVRRASVDTGKGLCHAFSFSIDTIGARGEFTPGETEAILSGMVA